ncbi:MAG: glutathione peroxidase [Bacteroidota bacterium]
MSSMVLFGQTTTLHDFTVDAIDGSKYELAELAGKKVMVVNTASKCGLTPQYEQLEALYQKYKSKGFVIVGFPANNFMNQEPGSDEEIAAFCEKNYGVSFPMMSKISVKGEDIHPVYEFLTQKKQNKHSDNQVKWNFQKYLINKKGELEQVIGPKTLPNDDKIISWIEEE